MGMSFIFHNHEIPSWELPPFLSLSSNCRPVAKKIQFWNEIRRVLISSLFFLLLLDLNQDLLADMIHRGRDHGLPTYTEVRNSCGLSLAKSFADLNNTIDDHVIKVLSRTYEVGREEKDNWQQHYCLMTTYLQPVNENTDRYLSQLCFAFTLQRNRWKKTKFERAWLFLYCFSMYCYPVK